VEMDNEILVNFNLADKILLAQTDVVPWSVAANAATLVRRQLTMENQWYGRYWNGGAYRCRRRYAGQYSLFYCSLGMHPFIYIAFHRQPEALGIILHYAMFNWVISIILSPWRYIFISAGYGMFDSRRQVFNIDIIAQQLISNDACQICLYILASIIYLLCWTYNQANNCKRLHFYILPSAQTTHHHQLLM
jgi:hypothetical protein